MPRRLPGIGIEVELGRRRRQDPEALVALAIEILDAEGVEGFSVRRLAERADAYVNSVTHHLGTRADILAAALDRVLSEVPAADAVPAPTLAASLRRHADGVWQVLRDHPGVVPILALSPRASRHASRIRRELLDLVDGAAVPAHRSPELVDSYLAVVVGGTVLHLAGPVGPAGRAGEPSGVLGRAAAPPPATIPPSISVLLDALLPPTV